MNAREQRGLMLAAVAKIVQKNELWVVPSETKRGKTYLVNLEHDTCTCPDHTGLGTRCKHLYAAEVVARREAGQPTKLPDGDITLQKKKVSGRQNWPAYNKAQTTEKSRFRVLLQELCRNVKTPNKPIGRRRVPMPDVIFACVFKSYIGLSNRRCMTDFADAYVKGYVSYPIHYNNVPAYLNYEPFTEVLSSLIIQSSLPLRTVETDFAVDSTGFSSSRYVRWFDERHGVHRTGHDWVKLHAIVGTKTNVVTAVEIRGRNANDAPLFAPLVTQTAKNFQMREISGDKAYLSEANINLAFDVGATPFIPFKDVSIPERGGLWQKMLLFYDLHREEFLQRYHKRSNVESTFSMIKSKFGAHVRSRCETAMKNEALCKVLAHNLCCLIQSQLELGIEPVFFGGGRLPEGDRAA